MHGFPIDEIRLRVHAPIIFQTCDVTPKKLSIAEKPIVYLHNRDSLQVAGLLSMGLGSNKNFRKLVI